jgi:uncharacterized protein YecE (DUF72 family)
MSNGIFRLGTSGIGVVGKKENFPEQFKQKSRLCYYSELFNSLEENCTHYKIPRAATFERWANEVREDFRFTFKLWREITHARDLKYDLSNINLFLQAANYIGNKKGCLLVQFPGKISLDYFSELEQVLERINELDADEEWKIAVEFRNASWQESETYEMLDEYRATLVLHDHPKWRDFRVKTASPFQYFRFHGPNGDYKGSYSNPFLEEKSIVIKELLSNGKDVYVYFNNTAGNAFENSMTLKMYVNA